MGHPLRGDMLMIALTAAGLTAIASAVTYQTPTMPTVPSSIVHRPSSRGPSSIVWTWLLAGAMLFSLAFYTKQTALAGPIATAAYLLIRDWRTGLKSCAPPWASFVLAAFAVLDFATNHWFYLKMVTYHFSASADPDSHSPLPVCLLARTNGPSFSSRSRKLPMF